MKRAALLCAVFARALFGWGCEGHQTVALIAEKRLTEKAAKEAKALLSSNRIDPNLVRFCTGERDDVFADSSTWADDVRRDSKTGKWHFIDIPRQASSGDASRYCEPVGEATEKGDRDGCVLTAIEYNRKILKDASAPAAKRAEALRYVIHFVGDLHQPLHATDNHDQGGNCAPMALLDSVTISNLHSVWDSGIISERLRKARQGPERYAELLDAKYAGKRAEWTRSTDPNDWVWGIHALGVEKAYGLLHPSIPVEQTSRTNCNAETEKVWRLQIHIGSDYVDAVEPVIDEQLAKAGYRLAAVLNAVWP